MAGDVPAVAAAKGVVQKLLRVSAGADAPFPETHVCNKTLALLARAKRRNFSELHEEQLGLYLAGFKMKGDDEDEEGQMRFVAGFRQLLLEHRQAWELENLDVFAAAVSTAMSSITENEHLLRLHEVCSELGTKHSSTAAVTSLKKLCLHLARAWAADKNMLSSSWWVMGVPLTPRWR